MITRKPKAANVGQVNYDHRGETVHPGIHILPQVGRRIYGVKGVQVGVILVGLQH